MKTIIGNITLADRLLLVFLAAASIAGIFITRDAMSRSSDVIVEIDGRPVYTFPLQTDRTVSVEGPFGETLIEIKGNKARIREAHCPNRLCVKEGWVSRGVIVCLPNRIVVFVGGRGDRRGKDVDAVTG